MLKYLLLICTFCFPIITGAAEIDYPTVIQKFRMHDGLSNDLVYDVCQDADGCMWFATAEGLSKYDGSVFSSYNWNRKDVKMGNNQAFRILYFKNKIYVAASFGLVVYNMETDHFKVLLPDGVNYTRIKALALSKDGNIWVGVYGEGGVYKYDVSSETFAELDYNHTDNRILSLYEDNQGYLYVGTHFGGLDVINLRTSKTKNYSNPADGIPGKQVEKILEDSLGNIWLGTWNGLGLYNKNTRQISGFTQKLLSTCQINALDEDKNGNLWLGSEAGLYSFNIREALVNPGDLKINVYNETLDEYGLSYKTVLALNVDMEDNVWIGTNTGGVNLISQLQPKFDRIVYDPRLENSLSYNRVTSVSEDPVGNLWITTDGGGVNYYDKRLKKITIINKNNSNLTDDAILSSLVDSDGDVWLGSYHSTLNRKTKDQKSFIIYNGSENSETSLMKGDVLCLEEDDYKRIWIGQRSGLSCFDKKGNNFKHIPELKWTCIQCIFPTKDGIYVGVHPGVMFYDFITRKVETPHPALKGLFANCLYIDDQENVWIGTNGQGLFCYNPQDKSLQNYNTQSGLSGNNICKILQDHEHNLWISTTKGITKFSKTGNSMQNFNNKDGVQPGMFIFNSGTITRSGQILFGGAEGLTLFYPSNIKKSSRTPNIIFTDFLLYNNSVEIQSDSNPGSPLKKSINYADEITLKYKESVFSIEYTAVNCASSDKINYAYILEGADKSWNYVKDRKSATYRYLTPGSYLFKVMASNLDDSFDPSTARTIKIIINPPFYLTWWAYLIYILIFGSICYFVWKYVTMKAKAHNQIRLERLERLKSEELHQEKLQFFTNVSHELRTPLTLISAPVDRLLNDETSEDKKYLLSMIKRNVNRMLNDVNEIMDLRKIDRSQMKLKVKELDIISFVEEVIQLFRESAQAKHIELEYSHQDKKINAWFDPEFLDKILCNILSNALKFTPDHGEIIVNLFSDKINNHLCIEIADTGKGISEKNLAHIFDRFFQAEDSREKHGGVGSGVGLHLVKSLVELHKGSINVKSKQGVGSTFTLSLPYTSEDYSKNEKAQEEYVYHHAEQLSYIAAEPDFSQGIQKVSRKHENKILIIDDDPEILDFLRFDLSNDYDIILAENGRVGLAKAYETIPDLIISDVMMPEVDGISLCKELKYNINTSHIPIILLTAKGSIDDKIEGLEVGADSYIPKPFDIRHLRVRIKKLIESRESIRANYIEKLSHPEEVETPAKSPTIDDILLQKIIKYVHENISDSDINGETLAKHVGMSRMSLHRKLKALTGLSSGEFIRNIRLDEAKKQLEAGGKTVSEISYDVGYTSPSYFYSCFIRKFGVLPSDFIK